MMSMKKRRNVGLFVASLLRKEREKRLRLKQETQFQPAFIQIPLQPFEVMVVVPARRDQPTSNPVVFVADWCDGIQGSSQRDRLRTQHVIRRLNFQARIGTAGLPDLIQPAWILNSMRTRAWPSRALAHFDDINIILCVGLVTPKPFWSKLLSWASLSVAFVCYRRTYFAHTQWLIFFLVRNQFYLDLRCQ